MNTQFIDAMFAAHGLPAPEHEYLFHPERKWRLDMAWPDHGRIAVEVEGGAWTRGRHTRGKGFIADLEKYAEAACLGWLIIRVTPQMLEAGQAAAWVKRVMESATRSMA